MQTEDTHIPGVATKCWVRADKVEECEAVWLVIGGQPMGLTKAGAAQDGWRPVWWFSNGVSLPLCLCNYHLVEVLPCRPDGTHDPMARVPAKWQYEPPTAAMRDAIAVLPEKNVLDKDDYASLAKFVFDFCT